MPSVQTGESQTVIQQTTQTVVQVVRETRTVEVMVPGLQGPPGEAGGAILPIAFSYGDVSSRAVYTAPLSVTLVNVRIIFDTPFNGVSPVVSVGSGSDHDLYLPGNYNDPTTAAEYENTPDLIVASGNSVYLYIAPGAGATQGAGRLLLSIA